MDWKKQGKLLNIFLNHSIQNWIRNNLLIYQSKPLKNKLNALISIHYLKRSSQSLLLRAFVAADLTDLIIAESDWSLWYGLANFWYFHFIAKIEDGVLFSFSENLISSLFFLTILKRSSGSALLCGMTNTASANIKSNLNNHFKLVWTIFILLIWCHIVFSWLSSTFPLVTFALSKAPLWKSFSCNIW